jgi:hypothetical protein
MIWTKEWRDQVRVAEETVQGGSGVVISKSLANG